MTASTATPAFVNGNGSAAPLIGVTMGDPCGIGAEVIVKALADPHIRALGKFVIYGINDRLSDAAEAAGIKPFWFTVKPEIVPEMQTGVVVVDFEEYASFDWATARPTAEGGRASLRFVEDAVKSATKGLLQALVTAPINKTSWHLAGSRFPGHTEKLADLFNVKRYAMMFLGGGLRVALASIHVGLFELRNQFTIGRVFQPIDLLDDALRRWVGIAHPRIAVAGLNPHAGEDGKFGDEERRIIEPAIQMARNIGIDVEGPYPADTLFTPQIRSRFDGLVAMYHDQGLIPVKMLAFDSAVNVTLGLPMIRTSVDHGTAFDIAGTNQAHPGSMKAAIQTAAEFAPRAVATLQARIVPALPLDRPETLATGPA